MTGTKISWTLKFLENIEVINSGNDSNVSIFIATDTLMCIYFQVKVYLLFDPITRGGASRLPLLLYVASRWVRGYELSRKFCVYKLSRMAWQLWFRRYKQPKKLAKSWKSPPVKVFTNTVILFRQHSLKPDLYQSIGGKKRLFIWSKNSTFSFSKLIKSKGTHMIQMLTLFTNPQK